MSGLKAALAAALACAALSAFGAEPSQASVVAGLLSRADGEGTTTYWGDGAHFEITGPGVTVFVQKREDAPALHLIRVVYVGNGPIHIRGVSFTVGERTFGPYADGFGRPSHVEAENGLVVEALVLNVDSDEKWQMLDGIAEASDLGRPVIAVFDADTPYGIELDGATKRATREVVRGFRELSVRSH